MAGTVVRRRFELDRAADVNNPNQVRVGTNPGSLDSLIAMCQEEFVSSKIAGTDAIAILSLAEGNKKRLGEHVQCFLTLIQLCEVEDLGYDSIHR